MCKCTVQNPLLEVKRTHTHTQSLCTVILHTLGGDSKQVASKCYDVVRWHAKDDKHLENVQARLSQDVMHPHGSVENKGRDNPTVDLERPWPSRTCVRGSSGGLAERAGSSRKEQDALLEAVLLSARRPPTKS